jgi:hypothetical protein
MNEGKLKTKIFIMQALDWALLIAVTCLGIYAVLYSEKPEVMATAALFGLLVVSRFGDWIREKVAGLYVDLRMEWRRVGKKVK